MTFTKGKHQNNLTETSAIRNGNRNAFNGLYQRLHQKLYFYVLKQTSSAYLAEEIVQITFIKLWEYRASLSDTISIDSQVFRIAKTSLIDLLRKRATERKCLPDIALEAGEENDAIACLSEKEMRGRLAAEMENLPPVRKKVFKLSREGGLSHKEIAEQLSLTTKNVENHIGKAIRQLKKALGVVPFLVFLYSILSQFFNRH